MDEIKRQRTLKELEKLNKDLLSYKKRQEKHISVKFTEGQIKQLEYLRDRIRFNYRYLKEYIEYGGTDYVKVATTQYNVFEYIVRKQSVNILPPELFTALDKAINIVNTAIKEIKAIPTKKIDWRDITVGAAKEEVKKEVTTISIPIQLHPKVLEVSQSLFETGHYSQAIFEAFKAVNNYVKEKTGLPLDGKDLMAKVFREKEPIIKLNQLKTKSERDEQEGFMFLFMGAMVGIRNPKAHDNIVQTDPMRTLEYLSLASLLMKRAEEGTL